MPENDEATARVIDPEQLQAIEARMQKWTDEQLRELVATSKTWSDVLRLCRRGVRRSAPWCSWWCSSEPQQRGLEIVRRDETEQLETPRFQDWAEIYYATISKRVKRADAKKFLIQGALRFWGAKPADAAKVHAAGEYHDLRLGDVDQVGSIVELGQGDRAVIDGILGHENTKRRQRRLGVGADRPSRHRDRGQRLDLRQRLRQLGPHHQQAGLGVGGARRGRG